MPEIHATRTALGGLNQSVHYIMMAIIRKIVACQLILNNFVTGFRAITQPALAICIFKFWRPLPVTSKLLGNNSRPSFVKG